MKYNWDEMDEQQKIKACQEEISLITHMGTTKNDLLNILRWLWNKFEIAEEEEETRGTDKAACDLFERFMDCLQHSDTVKVVLTGVDETEFTTREVHQAIQVKLDKYQEFAKAQAEGRLVVLPCKVGDTVWILSDGEAIDCRLKDALYFKAIKYNLEIGRKMDGKLNEMQTVFLTREAAEKALHKLGYDPDYLTGRETE
jgi:hypothetical protein